MSLLEKIESPADLKNKSITELTTIAIELRELILKATSSNGGHLASNLGVVELTIALHSVFNAPEDKIVWDVSHQVYAHKILTGRKSSILNLRQEGGCSGFASRDESEYDAFGAGHAGTAVSAALGMAVARDRKGTDEKVIAVVGDASIANGLSLEALNNVATTTKDIIIILNDNKMSISENVGSLTKHLNNLIQKRSYNKLRTYFKRQICRIPKIGEKTLRFIQRVDEAVKGVIMHGAFFEELGLRYIGPIDGHNLDELINSLTLIKEFDTPVLVHVLTGKGKGYKPAEMYPDKYHGLGKFDPCTGEPIQSGSKSATFSDSFGQSLLKMADKHQDIVGITAAMCGGTGMTQFAKKYPDRFFDVGIAEGHGMVFSAGLASSGLRPVFALYATFLQRAMSSLYHDICIQNLPVIICADRTGVVDDGPTHHGIYDLGYLRSLPNLSIIYPSTAQEMEFFMEMAYDKKSPVVICYPKSEFKEYPILFSAENYKWGKSLTLREGSHISIWTTGIEYSTALKVAEILEKKRIKTEVVNALFLKPFDIEKLTVCANSKKLIVTIEDNVISGGLASIVDEIIINCRKKPAVIHFGWPEEIIPHGSSASLRNKFGMTPESIAEKIIHKLR